MSIAQVPSYLKNKKFIVAFAVSLALLILALFINYWAGVYATDRASSPVTDIVLSNIPVFDVDGVFVYGPIIMWIGFALFIACRPWKIPFTLKSIALFIVIRSFFISLTHIAIFPQHAFIDPTSFFNFGADLFFSAHTGLPFLLALIFWDIVPARRIFIECSIFFGIIVLLGHYHYSIDVASAFFITYSIYHLARVFFKKDHMMFEQGIPEASGIGISASKA